MHCRTRFRAGEPGARDPIPAMLYIQLIVAASASKLNLCTVVTVTLILPLSAEVKIHRWRRNSVYFRADAVHLVLTKLIAVLYNCGFVIAVLYNRGF
jgi:hypothetical protein